MLRTLRHLAIFISLSPLALAATAKNCGCECCKGKEVCCCNLEDAHASAESDPAETEAVRHPLRGVIVAIQADDATLTVKHEAIPGVMPAMTMLFKVEPATLSAAKKGQAITAQMSRRGDDWWLHDVQPATADTR